MLEKSSLFLEKKINGIPCCHCGKGRRWQFSNFLSVTVTRMCPGYVLAQATWTDV